MKGVNHILALSREIRRDPAARYYHRLHGVLLVLRGMSCQQAGRLLGDSARSLQYWVKRFETEGINGLCEKEKTGRPRRLGPAHLQELEEALKYKPADFGLDFYSWTAKALSCYLERHCSVVLGLRQCQRLLRQLGCESPQLKPKANSTSAIFYDKPATPHQGEEGCFRTGCEDLN